MKKIVYTHYQTSDRDGSFIHVSEFGRSFGEVCSKRGTAFTVVGLPVRSPDKGRLSSVSRLKERLAPYYLHDIKTLLVQVLRYFSERAMLITEQPDVVLTRYNEHTISILWACRSENVPVALELNAPDSEKTIRRAHYYHLPGVPALFSNRHAFELAAGAFAVSEELVAELRQVANSEKPLAVIPNGVAVERFDPDLSGESVRRRFGLTSNKIVVGYVGSFPAFHAMGDFLDKIPEMVREIPSLHFLIVGHITSYESWLVKRVQSPALAPHVTLTGFVPPAEVPCFLAGIDVALLPSTAPYCSPLKIFEYMAMARPIVAPATKPVAAILAHGREGLLFEPGNFSEMVQAIILLAQDQGLRSRLGGAARARVRRDFTWRQNAETVYEFLDLVHRTYQQRKTIT